MYENRKNGGLFLKRAGAAELKRLFARGSRSCVTDTCLTEFGILTNCVLKSGNNRAGRGKVNDFSDYYCTLNVYFGRPPANSYRPFIIICSTPSSSVALVRFAILLLAKAATTINSAFYVLCNVILLNRKVFASISISATDSDS